MSWNNFLWGRGNGWRVFCSRSPGKRLTCTSRCELGNLVESACFTWCRERLPPCRDAHQQSAARLPNTHGTGGKRKGKHTWGRAAACLDVDDVVVLKEDDPTRVFNHCAGVGRQEVLHRIMRVNVLPGIEAAEPHFGVAVRLGALLGVLDGLASCRTMSAPVRKPRRKQSRRSNRQPAIGR